MIRFEVRTVMVETSNGKNAMKEFDKKVDQDTDLVNTFISREEAVKCYDNLETSVKFCGSFYEHFCKLIAVIDDESEEGEGMTFDEGLKCGYVPGDWLLCEFHNEKEN